MEGDCVQAPLAERDEASPKSFKQIVLQRAKERLEKIERERLGEARAAGFSSWEAYQKSEARRKDYRGQAILTRKALERKCALMGMTIKAYFDERVKRDEERCKSPVRQRCDCDGHPIPMFCAPSLVEYKSAHLPDLIGFFQAKQHQELQQLNINEGEPSKRFPLEELEQCWQSEPRETSEWPPWLKRDPILYRIAQNEGLQEAASKEHISPRLWTEEVADIQIANGADVQSDDEGNVHIGNRASIHTDDGSGTKIEIEADLHIGDGADLHDARSDMQISDDSVPSLILDDSVSWDDDQPLASYAQPAAVDSQTTPNPEESSSSLEGSARATIVEEGSKGPPSESDTTYPRPRNRSEKSHNENTIVRRENGTKTTRARSGGRATPKGIQKTNARPLR